MSFHWISAEEWFAASESMLVKEFQIALVRWRSEELEVHLRGVGRETPLMLTGRQAQVAWEDFESRGVDRGWLPYAEEAILCLAHLQSVERSDNSVKFTVNSRAASAEPITPGSGFDQGEFFQDFSVSRHPALVEFGTQRG